MKRTIALAVLMCGAAAPAFAADVGLGVSVESGDSTIYVPIDINETFRIEPLLRYVEAKREIDTGVIGTLRQRTLQIGTGLFAVKSLAESFDLYYGARLSYLKSEPDYSNEAIAISDSDGYSIAPTLGFEYSFNKHLSIGGEAEWFYQDINGDLDAKATGTDTRLILRFRF